MPRNCLGQRCQGPVLDKYAKDLSWTKMPRTCLGQRCQKPVLDKDAKDLSWTKMPRTCLEQRCQGPVLDKDAKDLSWTESQQYNTNSPTVFMSALSLWTWLCYECMFIFKLPRLIMYLILFILSSYLCVFVLYLNALTLSYK